jgi:hypothetical protein
MPPRVRSFTSIELVNLDPLACYPSVSGEGGKRPLVPQGKWMARPPSRSNLSLGDLDRLIHSRQRDLRRLYDKRRQLQRDLDRFDRAIAAVAGENGRRGGRGGFGSRPRNAQTLADTIAQVLATASGPTSIAQIVRNVLESGYRSSSENFRLLVNMTLVKDDRFQNAGRGLYVLKANRDSKSHESSRRRTKPKK